MWKVPLESRGTQWEQVGCRIDVLVEIWWIPDKGSDNRSRTEEWMTIKDVSEIDTKSFSLINGCGGSWEEEGIKNGVKF